MKFERLELLAFGRFNGQVLDFAGRENALHVIYGDNEAGKSTALRAIRGLLFGIPLMSPDTYVHAGSELRIGATLSEGEQRFSFVRRKGRKNTLLDLNAQPLAEEELTRWLGGVEQGLFDSMFGLDHTRLRAGALGLLALGGKVGASLFGASLGTAHFQAALANLRSQADELFTARGRSRPLNVEIENVRKAREIVNANATPPHVYLEHRNELERVQKEAASVSETRRRIEVERRELELIRRLLPLVAQWNAYHEQLQAIGPLPALPGDAEQQVAVMLRGYNDAQARHLHAKRELQRVETLVENRALDAALLAIPEDTIRQLTERLGSARKAKFDLPKRQAELDAAHAEIRVLLTRLGYDADLAKLAELRLSKDEESWLRRLIRDRTQYDTRLAASVDKLARSEVSLQSLKRVLAKVPEEVDVRALDGALIRAQKHVELEGQLERAKTQLETLDRKLNAMSERLVPWLVQGTKAQSSTTELWGGIPPVTREVTARFSRRRQANEEKLATLREETAQLEARRTELQQALASLEQATHLPSDEGLREVRQRRDEALERLTELVSPDDKRKKFTPDTFVTAVALLRERTHSADAYADAMTSNAAQIAERRVQQQRLLELDALLLGRRRRQDDVLAELKDLDAEWACVWQGSAFAVHAPETMSGLLDVLSERDNVHATRMDAYASVRHLEHSLAEVIATLSHELSGVGETGKMLWETLPQFVARLEGAVQLRKDVNQQRRDTLQRISLEQEQLDEAARELAALKENGKTLKAEWARATKRLGANKDTGPDAMSAMLDALTDVFHKVDEASALERRIAGIERDARELNQAVADVAANVRAELGVTADLAGLERLLAAYAREAELAVEQRRSVAELEQRKRLFQQSELELEQATQALHHWLRLTNTSNVEELTLVVNQVVHLARVQRDLADEERKIIAQGEGETLSALRARCEGRTSADVQAALTVLGEQAQALDAVWENLTRKRVQLEQTLEQLQVGAVQASEELQARVARLQSNVRKYLRLRLASTLVDREIERYRSENQGPVLARVQQLFPRLTLGRYQGVTLGFDEADEPILLCLNREGQEVAVDALSDGTRDQLYLSLRVASLEQYFRSNKPMPVILDDAFIHFDDDRAYAALGVLSELAAQTQVVFFTHHRRLLDLLRERTSESLDFEVHELRDAAVKGSA